jgi:signal transduction histidine kinase
MNPTDKDEVGRIAGAPGMKGDPMNKVQTRVPAPADDLRFRAEQQVEAKVSSARSSQSEAEVQRLIHELEIHQVELELQNAELRQSRDDLEASLEQYTELYDFAPVGYLTLDRAGTILAANLTAATLLEVERASLTGRHFKTFVGPEGHPAWDALLETIFTSGVKESAQFSAQTASNRQFSLQIEARAEASEGSCRAAILDVSARRRLEQNLEALHANLEERVAALAAANIDLEAFNYAVSHDLRKPLSIFYGYCEVLLQMPDNELTPSCREFVQAMYGASMRMKRLITSLLRFSCASRAPLSRNTLDLSALAHAVVKDLQLTSPPDHRIRFKTTSGIMGKGDPGLCRIALDNLIGNAWKHAGRSTETLIEFGAKEASGKQIYFVRDDGPGFDTSFTEQLFKPFQRFSGATVEGYGIGLATVERIVSRHGGRIWADGEPGKGATFFFTLE